MIDNAPLPLASERTKRILPSVDAVCSAAEPNSTSDHNTKQSVTHWHADDERRERRGCPKDKLVLARNALGDNTCSKQQTKNHFFACPIRHLLTRTRTHNRITTRQQYYIYTKCVFFIQICFACDVARICVRANRRARHEPQRTTPTGRQRRLARSSRRER